MPAPLSPCRVFFPPFLFFYVPSPFFLPARSLARSRYIYTRRGRICAARKSFDRVDRAILPDSRKYATTLWRNLCISTTCVSARVCVCVCGDNDYDSIDQRIEREGTKRSPVDARPSSRYLGNPPIIIHRASMTGPSRVEGVTRWDRNASSR